jgi:hypothetical protein
MLFYVILLNGLYIYIYIYVLTCMVFFILPYIFLCSPYFIYNFPHVCPTYNVLQSWRFNVHIPLCRSTDLYTSSLVFLAFVSFILLCPCYRSMTH